MRRGDIYVAAARGDCTGKPRPIVVIQDDRFDATASVTVCPLTAHTLNAPLARLELQPSGTNGLSRPNQIMVDKVTSIPRAIVRDRLGQLESADLMRLNRAIMVFLGLAG
ncbi:MAG: type II toxin-antitoxin system PemK/MazF family toxin [Ornithinimicrobium sp.]